MATQSEKSLYERLTIHFQACLDLPESERRKYVSKLAVSHPELERELSALLRFHQEDAAPTAPSPPSATEQPARESTRTRRTPAWRSIPVLILLVGAVSLAIILGVQVWALTRLETDLKGHMASNLKGAVDCASRISGAGSPPRSGRPRKSWRIPRWRRTSPPCGRVHPKGSIARPSGPASWPIPPFRSSRR